MLCLAGPCIARGKCLVVCLKHLHRRKVDVYYILSGFVCVVYMSMGDFKSKLCPLFPFICYPVRVLSLK